MRVICLLIGASLALSACGKSTSRVNWHQFDGAHYKHSSKGVDGRSDSNFVVTVSRVSDGLAGAKEAGRYEGTKYCIDRLGTSDILWKVGPDDADDTMQVSGDTLTLSGQCLE